MNAIVPVTNAEVYRASTDAAGLCKEIVLKTAQTIQGRKYVKVEGWQAIAIAHGCAASADHVERVEDEGMSGFKATGIVRRMSDGAEIARAEGFLGDDEGTWSKRPVYARRAMVQTRAISRACRSAFAHVVVLIDANLSTTPAEEVPLEGFSDRPEPRNITPGAKEPSPKTHSGALGGRKSSASAKRDGDDEKIKAEIGALDTAGLADWFANFDSYTAHLPMGWLDPVRDMLEHRREELLRPVESIEAEAELDEGFRQTVGPAGGRSLPGNPGAMAAE